MLAYLSIPLRGASHHGNSGDVVVKLEELRLYKEELEREERELDEQCQKMRQCLKNIAEDTYSDEYPGPVRVVEGGGLGTCSNVTVQ